MNRLFYLIGQGFENVWKNKIMFLASVLIIMTSMITLGFFIIIGENVNEYFKLLKEGQAIVAYVEHTMSEEQVKKVGEDIRNIPGVVDTIHETKEEMLQNIREWFKGNESLTEGWESSSEIQDSFAIKIESLENAKNVAEEIKKVVGVEEVIFKEETFSKIIRISNTVKTVVMIIFILLVGISLMIVSNTIKIGLHDRRKEIHIMKYIGATDNFIKMPFIIEGIIVGTVGAFMAWLITMKAYQLLKSTLLKEFLGIIGNDFQLLFLDMQVLKINLIIGIAVSIFACLISIKKYLKV